MGYEGFTRAYLEAIRRGFNFARELGRVCGPVHLLGISAGGGPAAAALSAGRPLAEVVASAGDAPGDGATYLHVQAQGAARLFAASLGQRVGTEHLLVALLDQGTTEVQRALAHAGADPATVRRAALTASGTALRPRLRSRKNLSGCSSCDTDCVLDLIAGQTELLGDRVDGLACPEQVDHVVDRSTATGESRTPEAVVGIDCHVRDSVLRQADELGVAIYREIDAPQVEVHDLGEDTLVVADDD